VEEEAQRVQGDMVRHKEEGVGGCEGGRRPWRRGGRGASCSGGYGETLWGGVVQGGGRGTGEVEGQRVQGDMVRHFGGGCQGGGWGMGEGVWRGIPHCVGSRCWVYG